MSHHSWEGITMTTIKEIVNIEETCPKCKDKLEWDSGSDMENEKWYCEGCGTLYEVRCEMVRFWDELEEVDK